MKELNDNDGTEFETKEELEQWRKQWSANNELWTDLSIARRREDEGWDHHNGKVLVGPWENSGKLPQERTEAIVEREERERMKVEREEAANKREAEIKQYRKRAVNSTPLFDEDGEPVKFPVKRGRKPKGSK